MIHKQEVHVLIFIPPAWLFVLRVGLSHLGVMFFGFFCLV